MNAVFTTANTVKNQQYPKGDVRNYASLVRREIWEEQEYRTGLCTVRVQNPEREIWTDAIQAALDENRYVYIPYFKDRIYIDKTLYIGSDTTLEVCSETTIALRPGSACCMLTNKNVKVCHGEFHFDNPDTDVHIKGGIWCFGNNGTYGGNGNDTGWLTDSEGKRHNIFSAISFCNVKGLTLENMKFYDITPFAVLINGVNSFRVTNIVFDKCYRDGIHVCGPVCDGSITNLSGETGDDFVALNAYDGWGAAMTLGKIENITVENISSVPGWMWSENRLLTGKFTGDDGREIDCSIENCTFRNCRGFHTYKGYLQAIENPAPVDRPDKVGHMDNLVFENIYVDYIKPEDYYLTKHSAFEMAARCRNITFRNIFFNFPLGSPEYGSWVVATFGPVLAGFLRPDGDMPAVNIRFENIYHKIGDKYVSVDNPSLCAAFITVKDGDSITGSGSGEGFTLN